MSPEAVTNRLKTMEQLWELSVNLMKAKPVEDNGKEILQVILPDEKSLKNELNISTIN